MGQYKLGALLIFLLGLSLCSYAQKYNFKKYSLNEGMPHSQISTIVQDSAGFMWFGTLGGGLARFDGFDFEVFTREQGLRDNVVNVIYEDSSGEFWAATEKGGVAVLNEGSFEYQFAETPLDTVTVYGIRESQDGRLWFATYGAGVFIYDGSSLEQLTVEDGLSSNYIWDFSFQQEGKVWIGTHNGLSIYDTREETEKSRVQTVTDKKVLGGYALYDFHKSSDGKLWIATSNGVTVYEDGKFEVRSSINGKDLGYVYRVIEDEFGNIWLGTAEQGIFRQFGSEQFTQVKYQNGLNSNFVYSLYKDHEDRVWVATIEDGASVYKGDAFVRYTDDTGFDPQSILSVKHAEDNNMWVGTTENGLWRISESGGRFDSQQVGLANRGVWVIEKYNDGLLLLMDDNTILEYDGESYSSFNEKAGIPVSYTIDVFVDSKNRVWIGTEEGVWLIDNDEPQKITEEDGLAHNIVWEITEDSEGNIWISTHDGLTVYSGQDDFKTLTLEDGLVQNIVSTVIEDNQKGFWIGTSGGISYTEAVPEDSTASFINLSREKGLKNADVLFLVMDEARNLWVGSTSGLHRLDGEHFIETGTARIGSFFSGSADESLEFAHKAVDKDADGNIWMGSINGLLKFDPDKYSTANEGGVPVYVKELEINFEDGLSRSFLSKGASDKTLLKSGEMFEYDENNLTFKYAAKEFENPEAVEFRYRLVGFNEQWSEVSKTRAATFTNLDPQDYEFQVEARGNNGVWGKPASFSFSIDPPFWATYWFYALVAITVVGMGYTFLKVRLEMLEKRRLKELVDEQTKELKIALQEKEVLIKEIHHRVKNNLAVISGLIELQMGYSSNEFALSVLKESQRRIQSISMIHEKLYQNEQLSEIDFQKYVSELLDIITYSFSHIEKDISVDIEVERVSLGIDQAIPCGLILNELISNSYEHAFKGKNNGNIKVTLSRVGKEAKFQISDNGVGMPDDIEVKKSDSLGLTLIETLVEQLQGDLHIDTSKKGTTFTILFEVQEVEDNLPI